LIGRKIEQLLHVIERQAMHANTEAAQNGIVGKDGSIVRMFVQKLGQLS